MRAEIERLRGGRRRPGRDQGRRAVQRAGRTRSREALPAGVEVGTVDKFQGQEARVVLYSMATSSGEDVPRGLDFLLSRNRLNVAISRAQCLAYLVCSPRLLEVDCRTIAHAARERALPLRRARGAGTRLTVRSPGGHVLRRERGRTFTGRRRVRLADMDERGRLRFDAIARFLQDVAIEDVSETGWGTPTHLWFVRRIRIEVHEPFLEDREVELVTWCSGLTAIAAGRRWSVAGDACGTA